MFENCYEYIVYIFSMIELLPLIYMTVFLIHVYIALQSSFQTGDNFDYRYIQNGFNFNCIYFYWNLAKKTPKTMRIIEESGTCTNVCFKFLCKLYFYYTLVSYTIKVLCAI